MNHGEAAARLDKAMIRLFEKLSSWEESVADQVGLTPRQCHAVSELGEAGRIRMKPLSERLGITTGTLTVMADRLSNLKLVQRADDPDDRRAFNIELTESGREIYRQHGRHHRRLAEELLSTLSAEEAEVFIPLLERMMQVL
jgi:DNA-binding MarR family transcriptional regulator